MPRPGFFRRAPREADEHPFQRQGHVAGTRRAAAQQRLGRQRQPGLLPRRLEFWEDRPFRLHDRVVYHRADGAWQTERLFP